MWFFQGKYELDISQSFKIWDNVSFHVIVGKFLNIVCVVFSMSTTYVMEISSSMPNPMRYVQYDATFER